MSTSESAGTELEEPESIDPPKLDPATLISKYLEIGDQPGAENYYTKDDRHNQKYSGMLVGNFFAVANVAILPEYEEHKTLTRKFSKPVYMLNRIGSLADSLYRLSLLGETAPNEIGLEDVAYHNVSLADPNTGVDVPEGEVDLCGPNPVMDGPVETGTGGYFEDLLGLDLRISIGTSGMRSRWEDIQEEGARFYLKTELTARVERPSSTPGEEHMSEFLRRNSGPLVDRIGPALTRAIQIFHAWLAKKQRVEDASAIAKNLAEHFASEASEQISFQERLQRLHSEKEEAAYRIAEETREEYSLEELAEEWGVDVRAAKAALDHWAEFADFSTTSLPTTKSDLSPEKVE